MKISPARTAAFDILSRIESERAFSSILLPEYEARLSLPDRGLCHELTLGVLRKQILLDRLIDHLSAGRKIDQAVRMSLRLGLYQLRFLDRVPPHSAVAESVNLVQRARKTSAKSFVNALLRRSTRERPELQFRDELDRFSVETSHPRWLIEKWAGEFGTETAISIAVANNEPAVAAFRFTANSNERRQLNGARESELVNGCFLAELKTEEISEAAARNEIYFQDEGSQLVGNCVELGSGMSFIDVCAAPGSKVTQIGGRASSRGNRIVAGDFHGHRVKFLLENCRRQGVDWAIVTQYNAEAGLPFEDSSFDVVLVDAPCSGTGTIRHNPEIRYFLEPGDFAELAAKQRRILENASKLVRKGGTLVYSTCSLEAEENEQVTAEFLTSFPDFSVERSKAAESFLDPNSFVRTFPHRDNMDGFFVASLRRT